jgi:hypothetical protein
MEEKWIAYGSIPTTFFPVMSLTSTLATVSPAAFLSAAALRRNAMTEMAVGAAVNGAAQLLFASMLFCLTLCSAVLHAVCT